VFLPLGAILALVLDMLIGFALMSVLLVYYHYPVTAAMLWLPALMLGCFFVAAGMGLTLSALNVRYRDVKYVVPFFTQMVFFLTPVIYPLSSAPPKLKMLLALNPMAGMIEGFRHAILGSAISADLMWISAASATLLFLAGLFMFSRMERTFADVI
jgi:lipopolysaccharide transport system permease protein